MTGMADDEKGLTRMKRSRIEESEDGKGDRREHDKILTVIMGGADKKKYTLKKEKNIKNS